MLVIIGDYFQAHHIHPETTVARFILEEIPCVDRGVGQAHVHYCNGKQLNSRDLNRTLGQIIDRCPPDSGEENVFEIKVRELHTAAMFEAAYGVPEKGLPGHAVLDTGASESVGTPQAVQSLIDAIASNSPTGKCNYTTDPTVSSTVAFRLADGSVRRPYSLVTIDTPRFGKLGVYVLEGMSAPILLSVREMRRRGMVIDFSSSRALITSGDELVELDVQTNSRGHLLINLAAP